VRAIRRILAELEFETLESVGLQEQQLDELAENALADYFISVAPAPWSHDEVVAALRAGLALGPARG
jgi:alcohol dehydrogenase class IV